MRMLVQVINLDRSTDRLDAMRRQLDDLAIVHERLRATDGRALSREDRAFYSPLRCLLHFGRALSDGEIGCYRSHVRAVERFVESEAETALILEDDAVLPDDFDALMQSLLLQLDQEPNRGWEVVNLGNAPAPDHYFVEVGPLAGDRALVRALVFPKRSTATLWSRLGAQRLLAEGRRIRAPIDHHLLSALSRRQTGFAVVPAPMPHSGAASDIDAHDTSHLRSFSDQSAWFHWRHKRRMRAARRVAEERRHAAERCA